MTFINLERVDTNFGKTASIKCPVCGNDFLVGADDSQSHGWPYLIHAPRVVNEEYIEQDEFTCPFLMKPIPLEVDGDNVASSVKMLREFIEQYSRMEYLQGTTCKYCNDTYELIYSVPKDSGEFSFRFGCKCIASVGKPDLIRLAGDFMEKYDKKMPERNKRADFLNSVISRMPKGAIKEN